jgi:hypothetical protein
VGRREGKRPQRIWEDHIKTDLQDYNRGRDSADGLDGAGIESRWRRDFPHPSRPALGPTQLPIRRIPGLSPGVKRPGRGVEHPPLSSAEEK